MAANLTSVGASAILEKKQLLEEDLRRVEKQIYELEGEYLQETVKDGNILRGWDSYLGKQASSGAIRRINRFREADRMFTASSVTSGQTSTSTVSAAAAAPKARTRLFRFHCLSPRPLTLVRAPKFVPQGGAGASASAPGAKIKKRSRDGR